MENRIAAHLPTLFCTIQNLEIFLGLCLFNARGLRLFSMLSGPLTPTSSRPLHFSCASEVATTLPANMVIPSGSRSSSVIPALAMTHPTAQNSPKRPKLSLQTSSLPITFGKSTTALALAASALPTASPTVLNTFNNAYDIPHRFSPATSSPTGVRTRPTSRLVSPFISSKESQPYQVSHGLRGILRNSPIPSSLRRSSLCPPAESPRSSRRTFFPATKKVTFRAVLEEEIETKTYIVRHSDLSSDEEESDPSTDPSSEDDSEPDETPTADADPIARSDRRKRKAGSDRQVEAAAIRDGPKSADRLQKRLKRNKESSRRSKRKKRQWEWTLGPIKDGAATDPTRDVPKESPKENSPRKGTPKS